LMSAGAQTRESRFLAPADTAAVDDELARYHGAGGPAPTQDATVNGHGGHSGNGAKRPGGQGRMCGREGAVAAAGDRRPGLGWPR
jgi:hypothetical protein